MTDVYSISRVGEKLLTSYEQIKGVIWKEYTLPHKLFLRYPTAVHDLIGKFI